MNKKIRTFLNKKLKENTTQRFIQDYIKNNNIISINELSKCLGISPGSVIKILSGYAILYNTKHKIFSKIETDYFINDEDGYVLNFKNAPEEVKEQLKKEREEQYQTWREEAYFEGDYRYHYYPKEYYKAIVFWCKMMREHDYNYYNVALDIASKYYNVDQNKLKEYITERIKDGKSKNKEMFLSMVEE